MAKATWVGVVGTGLVAATSLGQIGPVGPFTGPHTEGFETQPAQLDVLYECLPGRIFNGVADICDPETSALIVPQFWSLFCIATPRSGSRYVVGLEHPLEITFDQPASRIGGYFATVGGVDGAVVHFFDGATELGTAIMTTDDCNWTWSGWESAAPFTRVRIVGNSPFGDGGYIHMDDLEYRPAGAPCYANCDGSTGTPVLNVNDFVCFQTRFAAAEPYADCDHSGALNVNDFVCYQTAFAAGCP